MFEESRGDISRFVSAQANGAYGRALEEVKAGAKAGHWMWFVFPQMRGLGMSSMADYFGISGVDEAKAYLEHPVLGPRLREISEAASSLRGLSARQVFGHVDAMKLKSSMTLFDLIEPDGVFADVLDKFYGGARDAKTLELAGPDAAGKDAVLSANKARGKAETITEAIRAPFSALNFLNRDGMREEAAGLLAEACKRPFTARFWAEGEDELEIREIMEEEGVSASEAAVLSDSIAERISDLWSEMEYDAVYSALETLDSGIPGEGDDGFDVVDDVVEALKDIGVIEERIEVEMRQAPKPRQ